MKQTREIAAMRFACFTKRFLLLAAILIGLTGLAEAQVGLLSHRPSHRSEAEESATASLLAMVVQDFIAAGANDDTAARATYLAPKVFFYGHMRTRAQACRELASIYKLWPQRQFAPPEDISVFAIPNYPGFYKVTAVFEYERVSLEGERITGKSKLSCVFAHNSAGAQIIAVNERLLTETTKVYNSK